MDIPLVNMSMDRITKIMGEVAEQLISEINIPPLDIAPSEYCIASMADIPDPISINKLINEKIEYKHMIIFN
jgi:hypothetical protein